MIWRTYVLYFTRTKSFSFSKFSQKILFSLSPYISPSKFTNLWFICFGGMGRKEKSQRINPSFIWWRHTKEVFMYTSQDTFLACPLMERGGKRWKAEERICYFYFYNYKYTLIYIIFLFFLLKTFMSFYTIFSFNF